MKKSDLPISGRRKDVVRGVAWYTPEQWARVKASAVDPEKFEATYPEWLEMAEDALREIRRGVGDLVKVQVEADELAAWCLVQGKRNDAAARAEFASYKLRQRSV